MINSHFDNCLQRGNQFESGCGHALARLHTGHYESFPYVSGQGQVSGDGRLTINDRNFHCEFKSELNSYPNLCLETHGAQGRLSSLTVAAARGFLWGHYHGGPDLLIVAHATRLLRFAAETCGQSGVRFIRGMGDGRRASGYLVPIALVSGQPWARTYFNFSGENLTGSWSLN